MEPDCPSFTIHEYHLQHWKDEEIIGRQTLLKQVFEGEISTETGGILLSIDRAISYSKITFLFPNGEKSENWYVYNSIDSDANIKIKTIIEFYG